MPLSQLDQRSRFARLAVAGAIAMTVTIASWPTTRFVGVNYVVSAERVPLWKKASEFIERDARLRQVSRDVLGDVAGALPKAETALGWTLAHIKYAPGDKPVLDDHISSIIDRGYGQTDQQADVFTTLLTYGGVPAYWQSLGKAPNLVPISYVLIDGQWRVVDVTRNVIFRTASGDLATPGDIVRGDGNYPWYFNGYQPLPPPRVLRAELQMPWPRLRFELGRVMGTR
jgi:hypothetical protein